ncbi:hypothetical protein OIV83_005901 [Microbotryomycetes sp. JL201]|nr:hypothetical protein OIV83_005901 [Microbotryomycetes sp. JL201]
MRFRRTVHAGVSLLLAASCVQAQSSSSAAGAGSSSASTPTRLSSAAAPTFTGYPQPSAVPYSNDTAKDLAKYLPAYTFNLTEESLPTRIAICNQTTQFCASSKCTSPMANVTVNFCNENTMGWNCKCNNNAQSRLQPQIVPVNSYDCRLRTQACLEACQDTRSTYKTNSTANCQTACNYIIGSTCGTAQQFIPFYQVDKPSDKPRYYPDTSKGGVAAGITTSAAGSFARPSLTMMSAVAIGVSLTAGLTFLLA